MEKPEEDRTFTRKDQFFQHVRIAHVAPSQGKDIANLYLQRLANWWSKQPPPLGLKDPALQCGFCGARNTAWRSRCEHVASHFESAGIHDGHVWWPQRLPTKLILEPHGANLHRCPTCLGSWGSPDAHILREVWSCRYLSDYRALYGNPFVLEHSPLCIAQCCLLCGSPGEYSSMLHHSELLHNYRGCQQEVFCSWREMREHLLEEHGARANEDTGNASGFAAVLQACYSGFVCPYDPRFQQVDRAST
jgi:hypothetical protein